MLLSAHDAQTMPACTCTTIYALLTAALGKDKQRRSLTLVTAVALRKAWLVPHAPDKATKVGCGLGPTAAVHSGFNVSWGTALKQAVCTTLQKAVQQSGRDAAQMRVFVTGQDQQSASSETKASCPAFIHQGSVCAFLPSELQQCCEWCMLALLAVEQVQRSSLCMHPVPVILHPKHCC